MHEWIDFVIFVLLHAIIKNGNYDDDDVDDHGVRDDSHFIDVYIVGCYYYS